MSLSVGGVEEDETPVCNWGWETYVEIDPDLKLEFFFLVYHNPTLVLSSSLLVVGSR